MAKHDVDILIKARDEASRKMKAIGASATSMGRMIKQAALAAGAVGGITGAILGIKKVISLASDAEETGSKFAAVFKEESGAAEIFGDQLATAVNRSKLELKGYLASLQDTFVPLGFARDQARLMSQTMTQLAVDMASFNNKADADVIRDMQSAIVGNHETVRKYGVIITQTTLSQELMRMGVARGIQAASEQEKAQARLNLIIAGTSDAQGDAAQTAGSFANQMKGLRADFIDAAAAAGQVLLPAVTKTIGGIRDGFVYAQGVVKNWEVLTTESAKVTYLSFRLNLLSFWEDIKHYFGVAVPAQLDWLSENWKNIFLDIYHATKSMVGNMWENLSNFFQAVWGALKGEGWDFTWTALLDGFESTLQELPRIAAREISATEKIIADELIRSRANLSEAWAATVKKNQPAIGGLPLQIPSLTGVGTAATPTGAGKQARAGRQGGLAALESRFLTMSAGRADPAEATKANTATLVKLQQKTLAVQEKFLAALTKPKLDPFDKIAVSALI